MFLIEVESGKFVDAEKIDYININEGEVIFTLVGDTESLYKVSEELTNTFCNNLQAINSSITNIESKYKEVTHKDT